MLNIMAICQLVASSNRTVNLVIDQGNTICKVAVFNIDGSLMYSETVEYLTRDYIARLLSEYQGITSAIYSSVGPCEDRATGWLGDLVSNVMELKPTTLVPLELVYDRRTLGSDRLAAAVGAKMRLLGQSVPALVIDAGTAITYESLDGMGVYRGGNIAPGVFLRLKALHQFTSRLPLIESLPECLLSNDDFGHSTTEAMLQGVLTGLNYEIEGYIEHLRRTNGRGVVFLTGGDAELIASRLKSSVVIALDLVLEGLNHILEYNKTIC